MSFSENLFGPTFVQKLVREQKRMMVMRICLLMLLVLGVVSCRNDDEADFLFELPYQTTFTIPAGLDPFQGHFFIRKVDSRMAANLSERTLTEEDILSVDPRAATMTAVGSNARYNFIREVSVRIYAEDPQNNPTAPWKELFYRDDNNLLDAGSLVDLIPSLVNAREEALEKEFYIVVVLFLRTPSPQSIDTRLDFSLIVR